MARDNTPLLLIALHPKCKLFEIERGLPEYLETPLRASVRPFVPRVHTHTRARALARTHTTLLRPDEGNAEGRFQSGRIHAMKNLSGDTDEIR